MFSAESGDRVGVYAYVFSHVIFCFSWSELPCFFISLFFYILMTRFFYALIDLTDPFSIFSVEAFLLWSSVLFHHTRPGCFPGNCITTILWLSLIILVSFSWFMPSFPQIFSNMFWRKGAWEVTLYWVCVLSYCWVENLTWKQPLFGIFKASFCSLWFPILLLLKNPTSFWLL